MASDYLAENGTILYEDYPYVSASSGTETTCENDEHDKVFYLTDEAWEQVDSTYDAFKAALLIEPINISVAVGDDFYYYSSGVYTGLDCGPWLNHAM